MNSSEREETLKHRDGYSGHTTQIPAWTHNVYRRLSVWLNQTVEVSDRLLV
ncbi:MAG: hypothetical protein AAFQ57_12995 [Cyanobacteria bacterium J06626_14]